MMQNGRINSPKLRPRMSSSENQDPKHVHMFRDEGVDKTKYGHEGIMITHRTAMHHRDSYGKVTIPSQSKA